MPMLPTSLLRPMRGKRSLLAESPGPAKGGGAGAARAKAALVASSSSAASAATAAAASAASAAASAAAAVAGKRKLQDRQAMVATARSVANTVIRQQPPAAARLAYQEGAAPFLCTRMNVFTAISIVGVIALIIMLFAVRAQLASVETKLMFFMSTS